MLYKLFLSAIFLCLAIGCSVPPVYVLKPINDNGGNKVLWNIPSIEDEDAKTTLDFNEQSGNYFIFFTIIENKSDSSVTIYPEDIYAEIDQSNVSEGLKPLQLYALNPGTEIDKAFNKMDAANSQKAFNDGLSCLFAGALVVSEVADIGKEKTEEEINVKEDLWNYTLDKIDEDQYNYELRMYELQKDIEHWENESLWITTLAPGEKTGGLIYIPVKYKADSVKVIIPVGEKEHVYSFKQIKKDKKNK